MKSVLYSCPPKEYEQESPNWLRIKIILIKEISHNNEQGKLCDESNYGMKGHVFINCNKNGRVKDVKNSVSRIVRVSQQIKSASISSIEVAYSSCKSYQK